MVRTDYDKGGETGPYDYLHTDNAQCEQEAKEASLADNGKYDLRYAFNSPLIEELSDFFVYYCVSLF